MVQQFTREGNILTLYLNPFPMGEKAKTTCKFCLHLSTKNPYSCSGVPSGALPEVLASALTISMTSAFSSAGNKLGTSQVFRRLFMSSTKDSCFI